MEFMMVFEALDGAVELGLVHAPIGDPEGFLRGQWEARGGAKALRRAFIQEVGGPFPNMVREDFNIATIR